MRLSCSIVGLPNVGKSTIFNALTEAPAEIANYPFCTIAPNIGKSIVPDVRLSEIAHIFESEKIIPTVVEFIDVAGLVRDASKGAGLGNQFLSHIRETTIVAHVLRCFEDSQIAHVDSHIDPVSDMEVVETELLLADLNTVEQRLARVTRDTKSNSPKIAEQKNVEKKILQQLMEHLSNGHPAREFAAKHEENAEICAPLFLLTAKEMIYVCNVDEKGMASHLTSQNPYTNAVKKAIGDHHTAIVLCGKIESEITKLDTSEEKNLFLEALNIKESGIDQLIRYAYAKLGLHTFFTAGKKETRAWTYRSKDSIITAAGYIHSDMERGFIAAEVYHYEDLIVARSEQNLKKEGKIRLEGKNYVMQDGDIIHVRFNV